MNDATKIEMELLGYFNHGLVDLHEWATLRQIELYGRDPKLKKIWDRLTRNKSRCTACGEWMLPSVFKYWSTSGWVKFCSSCEERILNIVKEMKP